MTFDGYFDQLREGQRFSTRGRTVTEADVVQFAALSGDMHPQHVDAEWAASSRFGERIAHGMLVLSYAVGLIPFEPERVAAIRRVGDAVFKQPTRIGDTIRVEGEIAGLRELDDEHGLVNCRWRILNQRGQLVARTRVDVVWRREPQPAPERAQPEREPVLI
jgi:acyl dehydratase